MEYDGKKGILYRILVIILIVFLIIIVFYFLNNKNDFELVPFSTNNDASNDNSCTINNYDQDKPIRYVSDDPSIVSIDNNGQMIMHKNGEVTITIYYYENNHKKIKKCKVNAKVGDDNPISPNPDVKYKLPVPKCHLKVSSDGLVEAEVSDASSYGFDSKVEGVKELSRQLEGQKINASDGYVKITYYVMNDEKVKRTCSIVVKIDCFNNKCTYIKG